VILFADEGVDRQIVERLRGDGIQVEYVAELSPGVSDEVVLGRSRETASILVTADKDFGELVFRQGRATTGVLLLRLFGLTPATKALLVSAAIREHGDELAGAFAVLTAGGMRIRKSPPS
jgi:predicted nuclease of predicted toxin-antitoxin system